MLWPKAPPDALGEKLGAKRTSVWGSLDFARKAPWWSDFAVNRVVDAI